MYKLKGKKYYLLLFLSIFLTYSCENIRNIDFNTAVRMAIKYEAEEKYSDALRYINHAIGIDSSKSFLYVIKGKVLSSQGMEILAIDNYSKAIALNSSNTAAYFYKGISLSSIQSDDSAIIYYTKALLTKQSGNFIFDINKREYLDYENQNDVPAHTIRYFRGVSLVNIDRDTPAKEDFLYALGESFKTSRCQFYLGLIFIKSGDTINGCSYLQESLKNGEDGVKEFIDKYCK